MENTSITENNGGKYAFDAESVAEMARLLDQDRMMNTGMGGLFPEQDNDDMAGIVDVLDMACGPGGWAHDVAHAYPTMRITGIDISKRMTEYAQAHVEARQLSNIRFQVGDITQGLDFQENSFDLVNARTIVGFMTQKTWPLLLAECKRVLRPDGTIRLTEGEWGFTNSAAFEKILAHGSKFMAMRGNSYSPTGSSMGIAFMLPSLLRQAGFTHVQMQAHAIEFSFGTPSYQAVFEDMKLMFQMIRTPLLLVKALEEKEFDTLHQEALFDMQRETFCAITYILTVWGCKASAE